MIKRTLYFGNEAYLHVKDLRLTADFSDKSKESISLPIEDIGVVILDSWGIRVSQPLISQLLNNNAAIITCDEKRMPQGLILNLDGHHAQQEVFSQQLKASEPLKKNLWQQTVQTKIQNQAGLLSKLGISNKQLIYLKEKVKSGDPDNVEGRAAAFYWKNLFVDYVENFKRGRFLPEPNNLLNYGYAVLRAVIARNLVGSGLLPTFGIHHHNKYNAFCLADDVMEPYRPYVDELVINIIQKHEEYEELNTAIKRELLIIPALDVLIDGMTSPLMVASQRTSSSLASCFSQVQRKILYPEFL